MLKIDLHMHSKLSPDGEAEMESICEAAIEKGFKVIAITDHADFSPMPQNFNPQVYFPKIEQVKRKYKDKLKVLAGVEVGYRKNCEAEIEKLLNSHPFDIVVGSVHEVGEEGIGVTDEYGALEYFQKNQIPDAFVKYLEDLSNAVKFGHFDVVGHLDVIDRFGARFAKKMRPLDHYGILRRILEGVVRRDMALELNTSGLRHAGENMYPSREILGLYIELGGSNISLASDAHTPDRIGSGFDEAEALLRELKSLKLVYYEKRKKITL